MLLQCKLQMTGLITEAGRRNSHAINWTTNDRAMLKVFRRYHIVPAIGVAVFL